VKNLMACPVIIDLRNVYRQEDMTQHGFAYVCIGRSSSFQPVALHAPQQVAMLAK
jgi:hypothetical protein